MNILAVMAHPDDEAFAIAGTLKRLTQAGYKISMVETTDGGAGQVHESVRDKFKAAGSVKDLRREELKKSAQLLGISDIYYFDHPDGTLNNQDIFDNRLVEEIMQVMAKVQPEIVIAYDHTGVSWHIDHIVTSIATAKACYEMKDIVDKFFMFTLGPGQKINYPYLTSLSYPITHTVDISAVADIKKQALMMHETQRADWERFLARADNAALKTENFCLAKDNGQTDEILKIFKPAGN